MIKKLLTTSVVIVTALVTTAQAYPAKPVQVYKSKPPAMCPLPVKKPPITAPVR